MIFNVKTHFTAYLLQSFCTFMNTRQHIFYIKKMVGAITKSLAFHCYTIYTLIGCMSSFGAWLVLSPVMHNKWTPENKYTFCWKLQFCTHFLTDNKHSK